jgi:NAD(P)-dependent dehydrogenase (short-subunit alcohol dehydrogenase family)
MTNSQRQDMNVTRRRVLQAGGAIVGTMALGGHLMAQQQQQQSVEGQTWPGAAFGNGLLNGKVAVITGAARGIGRAIAVDMAANGADVVGIDICGQITPVQTYQLSTRADLDETARLVQQHWRKFMAVVGDVRDLRFLRSTADNAEQQFGRIDIVVGNAGTQLFCPLLEMEDWQWNDVIDNNLNGTAITIRAFGPKLVKRGQGRIIVVSSMQGKHGSKNMPSYSATKWGIIGPMKSAALELGKYKIAVNALVPRLVATPPTFNEARLRAAIAEAEGTDNPPKNPTAQQAAQAGAPHVPLGLPLRELHADRRENRTGRCARRATGRAVQARSGPLRRRPRHAPRPAAAGRS